MPLRQRDGLLQQRGADPLVAEPLLDGPAADLAGDGEVLGGAGAFGRRAVARGVGGRGRCRIAGARGLTHAAQEQRADDFVAEAREQDFVLVAHHNRSRSARSAVPPQVQPLPRADPLRLLDVRARHPPNRDQRGHDDPRAGRPHDRQVRLRPLVEILEDQPQR